MKILLMLILILRTFRKKMLKKIINIPSNKWAIKELENTRKFYIKI